MIGLAEENKSPYFLCFLQIKSYLCNKKLLQHGNIWTVQQEEKGNA